ncbi:uncharacterized protein BDR25DRAFT_315923 [Lindgomyces ingoldianus]|uniref:Uncharacterized protein n=1 Tax=Lindgomyces ingoldianus TaxID=673940 RepID=A0ACB6QN71_9PLEO|nr:uncharacterized protein BDR25DRAFT_315923 [Lindgomyces ingoldianus]KAF2468433.1 hypothetical protein BDR25DRAFT_315923 [Lindgomyces ingoldianus]
MSKSPLSFEIPTPGGVGPAPPSIASISTTSASTTPTHDDEGYCSGPNTASTSDYIKPFQWDFYQPPWPIKLSSSSAAKLSPTPAAPHYKVLRDLGDVKDFMASASFPFKYDEDKQWCWDRTPSPTPTEYRCDDHWTYSHDDDFVDSQTPTSPILSSSGYSDGFTTSTATAHSSTNQSEAQPSTVPEMLQKGYTYSLHGPRLHQSPPPSPPTPYNHWRIPLRNFPPPGPPPLTPRGRFVAEFDNLFKRMLLLAQAAYHQLRLHGTTKPDLHQRFSVQVEQIRIYMYEFGGCVERDSGVRYDKTVELRMIAECAGMCVLGTKEVGVRWPDVGYKGRRWRKKMKQMKEMWEVARERVCELVFGEECVHGRAVWVQNYGYCSN